MFGHSSESDIDTYSQIYNAIFDRKQQFIITGGEEGLIKIWDTSSGRLINSLRGTIHYI
jgi:hypothetical protein